VSESIEQKAALVGSGEPELVSPLSLFSPDRLDLVVKLRFFESLLTGENRTAVEDLYRRTILARTGGVEPPDHMGRPSEKKTIDHYVEDCVTLLETMQRCGFDSAHPIPVGNTTQLLNGSHRVACAAALGLKVTLLRFDSDWDEGTWDHRWFVEPWGSFERHLFGAGKIFRLVPRSDGGSALSGVPRSARGMP